MLNRVVCLSTVALWLPAIGCQKGGPLMLRDSEGRSFEASCPQQQPCTFTQKSGPARADRPAQALLVGSRLLGICDVKAGEPLTGAFDCRPLTCQSNAECPPLHGMTEGQCLNHHCGDAAAPLGIQDSVMLCLAGTGLGRESPAQIERYALALNCGTPCTIPAPCQQP
jgi:hypothetical protein